MTHKTVVEELQEQRDFLLANTGVKWAPRIEGEGCLVGRMETMDTLQADWLHDAAAFVVMQVLGLVLDENGETLTTVGTWNDTCCRSAGEAIAVLDEAIRLAKEDL